VRPQPGHRPSRVSHHWTRRVEFDRDYKIVGATSRSSADLQAPLTAFSCYYNGADPMNPWRSVVFAVAPVVVIVKLWRIFVPIKRDDADDLTDDDKALLEKLSRLGLLNAHQPMPRWSSLLIVVFVIALVFWFGRR